MKILKKYKSGLEVTENKTEEEVLRIKLTLDLLKDDGWKRDMVINKKSSLTEKEQEVIDDCLLLSNVDMLPNNIGDEIK